MRRSWDRNWIVMCAVLVHGMWGIVLLFDAAPLHTTPLGTLHSVAWLSNRYVAAGVYLTATTVAIIPIIWTKYDTQYRGLLTAIPQQFLLMVSFFTAVAAIINGCYPDGYVPDAHGSPRLFIFVDQLWPMLGMIMHTLSLLDWYWWSRVQ